MGYYTNYNLTFEVPEGDLNKIALMNRIISTIENNKDARNYGKIDKIDFFSIYSAYAEGVDNYMKWYDHDKDMILFSLLFPTTIFILSGTGEECSDTWRTYYKNGKMVNITPRLIWPDFNEDMLR